MGTLFTKVLLSILTSSCHACYIHTKCYGFTNGMVWKALYTHQMFKTETACFMSLVDFESPLRDEKKLLFEQENLVSESLLDDFLNLKI